MLAGCAALGPAGARTALDTGLPADEAAWLAATVCRQAFPTADPCPRHGGAPVLHDGNGRYRIRYAADHGGGFRVAFDSRLLAPVPGNPDGQSVRLLAAEPSASAGRAVLAIAVVDAPGGARLSVWLAPEAAAVDRQLRAALATAEALRGCRQRLAAGDHAGADRLAADALRRAPSTVPVLRADLKLVRARVAHEQRDLTRQRLWLRRALADAPADTAASGRLRALDRRLAIDDDASPDRGLDGLLQRTRDCLARDDLRGAVAWARRAIDDTDAPQAWRALAEALDAGGDGTAAHHARLMAAADTPAVGQPHALAAPPP